MPTRNSKKTQQNKRSPPKPRTTRAAVRAAERARALKERENAEQKSDSVSRDPTNTTVNTSEQKNPVAKRKRSVSTRRQQPQRPEQQQDQKQFDVSSCKKVSFEEQKNENETNVVKSNEQELSPPETKKRKVVVVDYMKHASQETKQRRATSTARKEQVGVEQQQLLSEEMRSMIGKSKKQSPIFMRERQIDSGDDAKDVNKEENDLDSSVNDGTTCFIDDSLLPFIVEESSSAAETGIEDNIHVETDDSDINPTDSPAKYLRKRFSRDERRRQSHEKKRLKTSNPYRAEETADNFDAKQSVRKAKSVDFNEPKKLANNRKKSDSANCKFLSSRHNRTRSPSPTLEDISKGPILSEPPVLSTVVERDQPCTCGAGSGRQVTSGESLVRITGSDSLKKRDYSHFVDHRFHDASYKSDVLKEREMVKNLCAHIASRENKSLKEAEAILENRGYGKRVLTMESFDIRSKTYGNSNYPTSSRLRCCYDHHTFNTIPILVPVKYYEDRNILTVFSNWVFCSFSCLIAWIERDAPSVVRKGDCIQMAIFVARKFFGLTDRIYPAPFRQQHVDYGGRLTTEQWRALCTTHCSFLQYPLAVSVPCTIVTEITLQKRLDRDVLARIAKRTEEAHANSAPEKPEYGDADAKGAYKRGKKEGKGRPMKKRTLKDSAGQMVTLDKSFLDQVINKARDKKEVKGAQATGIQALMGITTKPSQ